MSVEVFSKLPYELIDIIADFHDYKKYCFNDHKEMFREILNDIHSMADIMDPICPKLVYECWGRGAVKFERDYFENIWNYEDNYGLVGLYDDALMLNDFDDDMIIEN